MGGLYGSGYFLWVSGCFGAVNRVLDNVFVSMVCGVAAGLPVALCCGLLESVDTLDGLGVLKVGWQGTVWGSVLGTTSS